MDTDRIAVEAKAWRVGAARDLRIVERDRWDGDAARARIFEWAGWPDDPDPRRARRGFLIYDDENQEVRAGYKLPFADVVDGELVAITAGIRAAASRLPQTDAPEEVLQRARAVLDRYLERMREDREEMAIVPIVTPSGPRRMEIKSTPQAILDVDGRTVTGIASVMGIVDDGGDVIHPGAYRKTISERSHRFRWLWQHDDRQPPIAAIQEIREIGRDELPREILERWPEATGGLWVKRRYLDTPRGNEVLEAIRAGAVDEMSIGYDAIRTRPGNGSTVGGRKVRRHLDEIRLWEMSDVNWGMNPATTNLDIKNIVENAPSDAKQLKDWLESQIFRRGMEIITELRGAGEITRDEARAMIDILQDTMDMFHERMMASDELARLHQEEMEEGMEAMPRMAMAHQIAIERLRADLARIAG